MRERTPRLRTTPPPKTSSQTGDARHRVTKYWKAQGMWAGLWFVGLITSGFAVFFSNGQSLWTDISQTFAIIWLCFGVWGAILFVLNRAILKWSNRKDSVRSPTTGDRPPALDEPDDVFQSDPNAIHSWTNKHASVADITDDLENEERDEADPLDVLADRQSASLQTLLDQLNEFSTAQTRKSER